MFTPDALGMAAWLGGLVGAVGLASSAARVSRRVGRPSTQREVQQSVRAVRRLTVAVVVVLILGSSPRQPSSEETA